MLTCTWQKQHFHLESLPCSKSKELFSVHYLILFCHRLLHHGHQSNASSKARVARDLCCRKKRSCVLCFLSANDLGILHLNASLAIRYSLSCKASCFELLNDTDKFVHIQDPRNPAHRTSQVERKVKPFHV